MSSRLPPALLLLSLSVGLLGLGGCMQVSGDFGGVTWSPSTTRFAVADRHVLLSGGGTLLASQRPEASKTLNLLFSAAWANPDQEWRRQTTAARLTLHQDLAATDGLLITDLPLLDVAAGAEFAYHFNTGELEEPRDFAAAVVTGGDQVIANDQQGFGSALEITLTIEEADAKAHGIVSGMLELKRSRGLEQEGDVATGSVSFPFNLPVVAERRGKANLAIAIPIMQCASDHGPARAAACASEPPLEVAEAADGIDGFD